MYFSEFSKQYERQRNEKRRHLEKDGIEGFILANELVVAFEQEVIKKVDIDAALKTCTPVQRERVQLHYFQGLSFTEIAKLQRCDEGAVRQSISAALKKLKKYFS